MILTLNKVAYILSGSYNDDQSEKKKRKEMKPAFKAFKCNAHLSITAFRKPDLEMIKANILTKIHDDYINK